MTTLARLSFWVPTDQLTAFQAAYEQRLAPILETHQLTEFPESGRPTAEGVFSRLFAVETPIQVDEKRIRLRQDPAWQAVLKDLAIRLAPNGVQVALPYQLSLYQCAATGLERATSICRVQGTWHTFSEIHASTMAQDALGHVWFGTAEGAYRYDGQHWTIFTPADGLGAGRIWSIYSDRAGRLWFATDTGASRYDGQEFVTWTQADGLVGNQIFAILEGHRALSAGLLQCIPIFSKHCR